MKARYGRRFDPAPPARAAGRTKTGRVIGSCQACGAGIATAGVNDKEIGRCPACDTRVELRMVYGAHSAVPCNGSCMGAVGPNCDCACGGANHGQWFLPVHLVPVFDRVKAAAKQTERTAAHAARVQAARDKASAELAAAQAAMCADQPTLAEIGGERYADADPGSFPAAMRAAYAKGWMSPRMITRTVEMIATDKQRDQQRADRDTAEQAARASGVRVPTGRVTFTGTVTGFSTRPSDYRRNGEDWKITVRSDDGWTVHGTMPRALTPPFSADVADAYAGWHSRVAGQRVTLTATVKPKPDGDGLFGFFSRPVVPTGAPTLSHIGPGGQTDPTELARVGAAQEAERVLLARIWEADARRHQDITDRYAASQATQPAPAPTVDDEAERAYADAAEYVAWRTAQDTPVAPVAVSWADAHSRAFPDWAAAANAYQVTA